MTQAIGYAAPSANAPLAPFHFERRALREGDVAIDILYCGVCHSDIHTARNEWHNSVYPALPGHEIVGRVTAVHPSATRHKAGDMVAVGCMVDSCLECRECKAGYEQHCLNGATLTYNSPDRQTGENTLGGYSDHIVVREEFVLRVPDGLDPMRAAPLLCAGITTWSPLTRFHVGPGKEVAVVGLGGLGHMGVKFAAALGANVTMITTSPEKGEDARHLGAHEVLLSTDRDQMKASRSRFDFILNTIPVAHDLHPYLQLLRREGAMVLVGAIEPLPSIHGGMLVSNDRLVGGSAIGGIPLTQEMLDFCAERNILPDCEVIAMQDINEAYARMLKSDVKYRFVIDMASLKQEKEAA
ncbi:NAD(P)-dependent alcohol dehydrogenase [Allosphingosinicella flava]|uniref:NAD(P)-dependent alcohol dehydrogenase n=1 Tax=Allosphingosinicella flava TaxID=2771430 RepID=A0A7T2GM86_9SPHN|nr:NAD(P)-dependent alcohol dehydrogenase [Sphingosinicella flava]QPQ56118.1 NAD(P)-dependent alcohol dehydrogenase [Sphingosinicella flava]